MSNRQNIDDIQKKKPVTASN